MPYVGGFSHDVFVSYAHLDNVGPDGRDRDGWVDVFVDRLAAQVRQRLGSKDVDIWMDRQHAGNEPLTAALLGAAGESALLLLVMSPAYLNSEWCARERKAFLELAKDRDGDHRMFVVCCLDVDRSLIPEEIRDLAGWQFFAVERGGATRPLGAPDPAEPEFAKQIYALSQHLARQLARLGASKGQSAPHAIVPASARPGVFVARSTDDLEEREDQLRNHLAQAGIQVPPRRFYSQPDSRAFATCRDPRRSRAHDARQRERPPLD